MDLYARIRMNPESVTERDLALFYYARQIGTLRGIKLGIFPATRKEYAIELNNAAHYRVKALAACGVCK